MSDEHAQPHDPLNLEAIEREIRMNERAERARQLGMDTLHITDDCPPDVEVQFLQSVAEYESAHVSSHFQQLLAAGVELPDPDSLDDAALHQKLWEVIDALAAMDTFLCHTDHLSDRELYEALWSETLREAMAMMPPGSGWVCHYDLVSSGSDEDTEAWLRYYCSEEERHRWAQDFPDDAMPPHQDPPWDRDRHLPREQPALSEDDAADD